jgi:hypothetical protein
MDDEHLDRLVRQYVGSPQPSAADRRTTWRALSEAIRAEVLPHGQPSRSLRRVTSIIATAAIAIVVLVVATTEVTRPTAAEAALGEIATAARVIDLPRVPDQGYAYARSETVALNVFPPDAFSQGRERPLAYLVRQTREAWFRGGGIVQIRTTTDTPTFFSDEDEDDYFAAGLDLIDRVGVTTTEAFDNVTSILDARIWPTSPDELGDAIRQSLPQGYDRPQSVEVLDLALALLRLPDASPPLRAAALQVIAGLDLSLEQRRPDGGGTFTITYDQPQTTAIAITIDGSGRLLRESTTLVDGDPSLGIPPGTVAAATTYESAKVVGDLSIP